MRAVTLPVVLTLVLTVVATSTAAARPPASWPTPWKELDFEEEQQGTPIGADDQLHAVCAEQARTLGEDAPPEWECRRMPLPGGVTSDSVALVRLVSSFMGVLDVGLLALRSPDGSTRDGADAAPPWVLGAVVADASYSGVGGWSQAATVDSVEVAGDVVVVHSRGFWEDTDLGTNAQMESRTALLTVCAARRCASTPTWIESRLSKVTDEEPAPPAEYGRLGKRLWSRPIVWDGRELRVGRERGKRPDEPASPAPKLPKRLTPAAFVEAFRR